MIDLALLFFSREQQEIQAAGTRVLLVVEPLDVLTRMFPTKELRDRVEAGERRLKKAKHLRFTNEAGTDVTYDLANTVFLPNTDIPTLQEGGIIGREDFWLLLPARMESMAK